MGKVHRHGEMNRWLISRSTAFVCQIDDVNEFGAAWWRWWASHQTDRVILGDGTLSEALGKLNKVRIAGPNGLITAIVWLAFWNRLKLTPSQKLMWEKAVSDVARVLVG
jgi:hypothetical protein